MNHKKFHSIPTNIITGFLGAGKTSAILHLLKQKPADERWAVLVNEFGEIGVDGSLMASQIPDTENIFIREVSGGCMCCSSGLTMQVALKQILNEAKPDRLLIEPTGLGHPIEVLEVLSNQYYQDVLSLEKTLTLIDARNLADQRYTEHEVFNQQLSIADIIVGSKLDLYHEDEKQRLIDYTKTQQLTPENIVFIENGQIPLNLLSGKTRFKAQPKNHRHSHRNSDQALTSKNTDDIPKSGYVKAVNKGEGFQSVGWRFDQHRVFNHAELYTFLTKLDVIRLKAVFITSKGSYAYNIAGDTINEVKVKTCDESRIEIICRSVNESWQQDLLNIQ